MELIKSYLTKNPCYIKNQKSTSGKYKRFQDRGPLGIMVHSVGVPQPKAPVFVNSWNKSTHTNSCVHAFIESDGDVYQTLPWNYRAWHSGSSANDTHIGIELCEPDSIKYTSGSNFKDINPSTTKSHTVGTYNTAVELCVTLCKQYNLNPLKDGVLISHKEGYKRGIASNHGDPEHLWSKFGLSMDKFRKDVSSKMKDSNSSFLVKVIVDSLNIRKGPGVSYDIVKAIEDNGVYTIVDTKGDWGLLKSYSKNRDGWINTKYTSRL